MARLRPQRQARARRRPDRFRQRGRRHRRRTARRRQPAPPLRGGRAGRAAAGTRRPHAAPALHCRQARGRRARCFRLSDDVRAGERRRGRAHRRLALHASPAGGAGTRGRSARDAHSPCRRGDIPAREGRGYERACHAQRVGPDRSGDRRAPQPGPGRRRACHRGGHHFAPAARKRRGGDGRVQPFEGDTDIFITPGYAFGWWTGS
jgi:hypothetical protein